MVRNYQKNDLLFFILRYTKTIKGRYKITTHQKKGRTIMNARFTYDFTKKAIVGTKTSIRKANAGLNPEYEQLSNMLKEHPDFIVVEKVINHKAQKKTYKNLSIESMKKYIELQPNKEVALEIFEEVLKIATAKNAKYPLTKKWFLKTYPEYKESDIAIDVESNSPEETPKSAAAIQAAEELAALENEEIETNNEAA